MCKYCLSLTFIVDCGNITDFINGEVIRNGTVLNSKATLTCNSGYTLVGNITRVCLSTGNWSGYAYCVGEFWIVDSLLIFRCNDVTCSVKYFD